MSCVIGSETWATITEKGAKLLNGQIARKFALGAWTKLRVGVRYWAQGQTTPTSGAVFAFGLCSGTTLMPGDPSCTHFVGYRSVNATTGAKDCVWTVQDFLNKKSTYYTAAAQVSKLVGTTYTGFTSNETFQRILCGPHTSPTAGFFTQAVMLLQYEVVSSSQMTIRMWHIGSSHDNNEYYPTQVEFYSMMEGTDPTTVKASFFDTVHVATNQAVNQGVDGTLDTIYLGWDRSAPFIHVNDMAVVRHL